MTSRGHYIYKLYDLAIHSEFELADLSPLDPIKAIELALPIVEIVSGKVPETLPDAVSFGWIEASRNSCIFHIRDKCRLQINNGNQIVLDAFASITEQETCAYIVGCGFPTLAHMRTMVPLHVSVVNSPVGALMFTGPSGAGKSTTATVLARELGWSLLCDDLCVLQLGDFGGEIHFGINKIKLWENTISFLNLDRSTMQPDHMRPEKFHLQIDQAEKINVRDLRYVFRIGFNDFPSIARLEKPGTFEALMNSIHGPFLVNITGNLQEVRSGLLKMSSGVAGYEMRRAQNQHSFIQISDFIISVLKKEADKNIGLNR